MKTRTIFLLFIIMTFVVGCINEEPVSHEEEDSSSVGMAQLELEAFGKLDIGNQKPATTHDVGTLVYHGFRIKFHYFNNENHKDAVIIETINIYDFFKYTMDLSDVEYLLAVNKDCPATEKTRGPVTITGVGLEDIMYRWAFRTAETYHLAYEMNGKSGTLLPRDIAAAKERMEGRQHGVGR